MSNASMFFSFFAVAALLTGLTTERRRAMDGFGRSWHEELLAPWSWPLARLPQHRAHRDLTGLG